MGVIGISASDQHDIFRMLSSILWLGNVSFKKSGNDGCVVADDAVLNWAAYLMGVDGAVLKNCLQFRKISTGVQGVSKRNSVYNVPQTPEQAAGIRDALAKAMYDRLFNWLVAKINEVMQKKSQNKNMVIGVLDIYGFEIFNVRDYPRSECSFIHSIFHYDTNILMKTMHPIPGYICRKMDSNNFVSTMLMKSFSKFSSS